MASLFVSFIASSRSLSFSTVLIPLPPPPCAAFTKTGYPTSFAIFLFSFIDFETSPFEPGIPLIPTSDIALFARILSPISFIVSDFGPTKIKSDFVTCSAKSAFSERKPNPGCIASAPVISAALIIDEGNK